MQFAPQQISTRHLTQDELAFNFAGRAETLAILRPKDVELATLDSLPLLAKLRLEMQSFFPDFPKDFCSVASHAVAQLLRFEQFVSRMQADAPSHLYNHDPKCGLYYDLTADQFPGVRGQIVITNRETLLMPPDELFGHELDSSDFAILRQDDFADIRAMNLPPLLRQAFGSGTLPRF